MIFFFCQTESRQHYQPIPHLWFHELFHFSCDVHNPRSTSRSQLHPRLLICHHAIWTYFLKVLSAVDLNLPGFYEPCGDGPKVGLSWAGVHRRFVAYVDSSSSQSPKRRLRHGSTGVLHRFYVMQRLKESEILAWACSSLAAGHPHSMCIHIPEEKFKKKSAVLLKV